MAFKDELGNRMKTYYEQIPKTKLVRRMPVIIRIDGKSFHTFTRGLKRPFDDILIKAMQETTRFLCENVQGCVLGYTQSDEISLVLIDYQTFDTDAWFDYEIQKMCSVGASMATMAFNRGFSEYVREYIDADVNRDMGSEGEDESYRTALLKAVSRGAMFDARVFNIPKEEVTNCIYWRQLDAARNSIQMVGQAHFSHKQLHGKSGNDIQDMLMEQKGINWNDFPTYQKRGSCVVKNDDRSSRQGKSNWTIDKEIPIFKGDGRDYIERLILVGEE